MPHSPTTLQALEPQLTPEAPTPTLTTAAPVATAAVQPARPNVTPGAWAKALGKVAAAGGQLLQLQRQYGNRYVQRVVQRALAAQAEPTLLSGDLQNGGELGPEMQARIQRAQSGGQALEAGVTTQMSSAFGTDLSGVRVHTDGTANQLNQELGAQAFTLGRHIFFSEGQYSPGTDSGQQLIAHELTHVVQQNGLTQSENSGPLQLGAAHDPYENEADQMARQIFQ